MVNSTRWRTRDRETVGRGDPDARVEDIGPVHIDRERMDRALAGKRHRLPKVAKTPEDICSFLDMLSKESK